VKFLFALFVGVIAAVGVVASCSMTPPPVAETKKDIESRCILNEDSSGVSFWRCVANAEKRPMTELEVRKENADRDYRRCTGGDHDNIEVQSSCMAQVYPTCNAARYDPNTCLIPPPR
jgi:hypothetical protein